MHVSVALIQEGTHLTGCNEITQRVLLLTETHWHSGDEVIAAVQAGVTEEGKCPPCPDAPASAKPKVRRSLKAAGILVASRKPSGTSV